MAIPHSNSTVNYCDTRSFEGPRRDGNHNPTDSRRYEICRVLVSPPDSPQIDGPTSGQAATGPAMADRGGLMTPLGA
jgi:hypothetical protein